MAENNEFPISYHLTTVSVIEDKLFGGKELELDKVQLFFEEVNTVITLKPLPDTDEIEISQQIISQPFLTEPVPSWCQPFIGQQLQALWVCDNNQDYQDMVVFGFGWLRPSLTFVCEASVLLVLTHNVMNREPHQIQRIGKKQANKKVQKYGGK
ncbi:DUF6334 family protein [Anaerolineales bacterium HSG6]|nr:DUF6334 family protein [Anaerolineales bacterium HSG6]